jgi:hypothetical protein
MHLHVARHHGIKPSTEDATDIAAGQAQHAANAFGQRARVRSLPSVCETRQHSVLYCCCAFYVAWLSAQQFATGVVQHLYDV